MRIFQWMYDKALGWAKHRHAGRYLFGLSFTGSLIVPRPPVSLLAPITLAGLSGLWLI